MTCERRSGHPSEGQRPQGSPFDNGLGGLTAKTWSRPPPEDGVEFSWPRELAHLDQCSGEERSYIPAGFLMVINADSGKSSCVGFQVQHNGTFYEYHIENGFTYTEMRENDTITRPLSYEEAQSFCNNITSYFWRRHQYGSHRVAQRAAKAVQELKPKVG